MTEDEAQAFVDARKAHVERWIRKKEPVPFTADSDVNTIYDPSGEWVAVSYWHGPKMDKRVHTVGRNLVEAVEKAKFLTGED